ncbi:MAG: hypothetical protein ACQERS_05365 [Bacteroidota bacterium]
MKRMLIIPVVAFVFTVFSSGQQQPGNPSYRYYAMPGFINYTEFNYGTGLGETGPEYSNSYWGFTSVFGFQANRNFSVGAGTGFHYHNNGILIPVYIENRYSMYLKYFTPYLLMNSGMLLDPEEMLPGTKLFINPGAGISRCISHKVEINFSAGVFVHMSPTTARSSFINFKLGIIFRDKAYRMFKAKNNNYYY